MITVIIIIVIIIIVKMHVMQHYHVLLDHRANYLFDN